MSSPIKFYVATYGDLGIDVEFFREDQQQEFDAAIAEAESQHDKGDLDTYTYGDVK